MDGDACVTCEGEENKMEMLLKDIENARNQPVVEAGGMSTSACASRGVRELKRLDCFVHYDRGMSEVQRVKGRGRGHHGVL